MLRRRRTLTAKKTLPSLRVIFGKHPHFTPPHHSLHLRLHKQRTQHLRLRLQRRRHNNHIRTVNTRRLRIGHHHREPHPHGRMQTNQRFLHKPVFTHEPVGFPPHLTDKPPKPVYCHRRHNHTSR